MISDSNPTLALAEYVVAARAADLPENVERQAVRTFLNIVGCALGGARHESVETAVRALLKYSGPPDATLIGRGQRCDIFLASLLNAMSSSVYSFDDTHAQAVVHPGGAVAMAMLALAEVRPVKGADFLLAFALGTEVVCRISKAISVAPARTKAGWIQTGVTAGLGAAVGVGKLLGLNAQRLSWAMGIAACQAGGMRALTRSMCFSFMAGQAAQAGLRAALMSEQDFTSGADVLGAKSGFAELYSDEANLAVLTDGLGSKFEILDNTFKPYPCGVVIHPVIDACLELGSQHAIDIQTIKRVSIKVNPTAMSVADIRHPQDSFEGQMSLQHWAAAALVDNAAGIAQSRVDKLRQPSIVALRGKIDLVKDAAMARDASEVTISFESGNVMAHRVEHCRGGAARPMTDDELERKFRDQAREALPAASIDALLEACRTLSQLDDMGEIARAAAGAETPAAV